MRMSAHRCASRHSVAAVAVAASAASVAWRRPAKTSVAGPVAPRPLRHATARLVEQRRRQRVGSRRLRCARAPRPVGNAARRTHREQPARQHVQPPASATLAAADGCSPSASTRSLPSRAGATAAAGPARTRAAAHHGPSCSAPQVVLVASRPPSPPSCRPTPTCVPCRRCGHILGRRAATARSSLPCPL